MTVIHHPVAYESAVNSYILSAARKKFFSTVERAQEVSTFLSDEISKPKPFPLWESFYDALWNKWGKLSEKQVACVLKAIDSKAAKKAEWAAKNAEENAKSSFVGEVGQKIILDLRLINIVEIQVPKFHYYDSGVNYINIFKDKDGNVFLYRGKSNVGNKGERVRIQAVIKSHDDYKGCKQTVVQRPKLLAVLEKGVA